VISLATRLLTSAVDDALQEGHHQQVRKGLGVIGSFLPGFRVPAPEGLEFRQQGLEVQIIGRRLASD
jgi:hypothetical protein